MQGRLERTETNLMHFKSEVTWTHTETNQKHYYNSSLKHPKNYYAKFKVSHGGHLKLTLICNRNAVKYQIYAAKRVCGRSSTAILPLFLID